MGNVVLVVDMLRGFLEPGHNLYTGDDARAIIPRVQRLLDEEIKAGARVLFIRDTHDPDDLEFEMFPEHCVRGTAETEVIPELAGYEGDHVAKNRYSAFYGTDLADRLEALQPDKVIVAGVCTEICVLHTTADARSRDYTVEVPTDCVASFDPDAHRWALQHMERVLGARLTQAVG